jgi:nucleotide-binding universal stress UspA family protein
MTSASFIVHADRDEESDARIRLACSLAARFDARLIGLAAAMLDLPVIDPMGYAPIDGETIACEREILESDLKRAAEKFALYADAKKLTTEWRANLEFPADMLCRHARAADLLIIGRGEAERSTGPQRVLDPGDVLMRAGRPVLLVPSGVDNVVLEHVVIAWKDTRESRRAVADALPFLQAAHAVSILEFCTEDEVAEAKESVSDVASYLGRHGVVAKGEARILSKTDPAAEIIAFATEKGADLIVAGAYGHARLREWALGGVTYELIKRSPVCCLLSH